VHFLRFEFSAEAVTAFRGGRSVAVGIEHPNYPVRVDEIAAEVQGALAKDFS
jgi:hypothetical protein